MWLVQIEVCPACKINCISKTVCMCIGTKHLIENFYIDYMSTVFWLYCAYYILVLISSFYLNSSSLTYMIKLVSSIDLVIHPLHLTPNAPQKCPLLYPSPIYPIDKIYSWFYILFTSQWSCQKISSYICDSHYIFRAAQDIGVPDHRTIYKNFPEKEEGFPVLFFTLSPPLTKKWKQLSLV